MAGRKKTSTEKEVVTKVNENIEVEDTEPVVDKEPVKKEEKQESIAIKPIYKQLVTTGEVALRKAPTVVNDDIVSYLSANRRFSIEKEMTNMCGTFYKLTNGRFILKNEKNIKIL